MEVVVEIENQTKVVVPSVGDILEFFTGKGESTYYLVCATNIRSKNDTQYFIINLNGRKGNDITYYNSLYDLVSWRKEYKVYSGKDSRLLLTTLLQ